MCKSIEKGPLFGYNIAMDKQKKVFYFYFNTSVYITIAVMLSILSAFMIFTICRLAGVGSMVSVLPALDILSIVISLLVATAAILFVSLTRYVVTPGGIDAQRVMHHRISFDDCLLIRHDLACDLVVLFVRDDSLPNGVRGVVLHTFPKKQAELIATIQKYNHSVSYDIFDSRREGHDGSDL